MRGNQMLTVKCVPVLLVAVMGCFLSFHPIKSLQQYLAVTVTEISIIGYFFFRTSIDGPTVIERLHWLTSVEKLSKWLLIFAEFHWLISNLKWFLLNAQYSYSRLNRKFQKKLELFTLNILAFHRNRIAMISNQTLADLNFSWMGLKWKTFALIRLLKIQKPFILFYQLILHS